MDLGRLRTIQEEIEKRRQWLAPFGDHWRIKKQIDAARGEYYWRLQAQMDAARQYDLFRRRIEDVTFAPLLPELLALKFETTEWRAATRSAAEKLQSDIGAI
jgi:hypothetical protein